MKITSNFKLILFGFLLVFFVASCVKDGEMGPAGPAGKDGATGPAGKDGSDGKDGVDGDLSCLGCHTSANMEAKQAQYELSKHFYGGNSRRNTKYCARCHTNEGALEIMAMKTYFPRADIPTSTAINCGTCHKHSSFEFGDNPAESVLRNTSPVYLAYNNYKVATDFGKINNMCAECHQIRGVTTELYDQLPFFPLDNSLENTTVKYQVGQSFSVHDGNQTNLFAGINGYEYAGKTYIKKWKHQDWSCTTCHMNEYNAENGTGGHTLKPNEEKCLECHGGYDNVEVVQTQIAAKLSELEQLLWEKKIFEKRSNGSYRAINSHDAEGKLFLATENEEIYALSISSSTGEKTYGKDTNWANRIGREWKYGELGAAYNYGYINSELSMGVHNPKYAFDILQKSIDYLKSY